MKPKGGSRGRRKSKSVDSWKFREGSVPGRRHLQSMIKSSTVKAEKCPLD